LILVQSYDVFWYGWYYGSLPKQEDMESCFDVGWMNDGLLWCCDGENRPCVWWWVSIPCYLKKKEARRGIKVIVISWMTLKIKL